MDITAIIAVGATRRAFIFDKSRDKPNTGDFNFSDYLNYALVKTFDLINNYFDAGGANLILELLDIPRMTGSRGHEYTKAITKQLLKMSNEDARSFYHSIEVNPRFIGLEPFLLHESMPSYGMAVQLDTFNRNWDGNYSKQLLLNVAPITLLSLHQAHGDSVDMTVQDLQRLESNLYDYYSEAVYGTTIPKPQAYIGASLNGEMKLNTSLPLALGLAYGFRLFFTEYPTFNITTEYLREIIDDVKASFSKKPVEQYNMSPQEAAERFAEIKQLSDNNVIWGLRNEDSSWK